MYKNGVQIAIRQKKAYDKLYNLRQWISMLD